MSGHDRTTIESGTPPLAPGGHGEPHASPRADDPVNRNSDASFPASDPPGWAGSGGVSRNTFYDREAPPEGPQAGWTVEEPAAAPAPGSEPEEDRS